MVYLQSNCYHKEDLARDILRRDRVREGLITVISAVEPCRTWFVRGNKETKHLELKLNWGKCIHLYFYFVHRQLDFLYLRSNPIFPVKTVKSVSPDDRQVWLGDGCRRKNDDQLRSRLKPKDDSHLLARTAVR